MDGTLQVDQVDGGGPLKGLEFKGLNFKNSKHRASFIDILNYNTKQGYLASDYSVKRGFFVVSFESYFLLY